MRREHAKCSIAPNTEGKNIPKCCISIKKKKLRCVYMGWSALRICVYVNYLAQTVPYVPNLIILFLFFKNIYNFTKLIKMGYSG